MQARKLILLFIPVLLVVAAFRLPTERLGQGGQGGGQRGGPLGAAMHQMEEALDEIHKALKADEDDGMLQVLPEIWKAQKAAIDAKAEAPRMIAGLKDDKAKKKALGEYREQMQDLVRGLLDLETQLMAKNAKKSGKALRTLEKLESKGHGKFKPRRGAR